MLIDFGNIMDFKQLRFHVGGKVPSWMNPYRDYRYGGKQVLPYPFLSNKKSIVNKSQSAPDITLPPPGNSSVSIRT